MLNEMLKCIDESWNELLKKKLKEELDGIFSELSKKPPYQPKGKNIFNVFKMPISDIKVVILGQDPYPTEGKATGRAFAVPPEYKVGKRESLSVIKEEIEKEKVANCLDLKDEWQTLEHWIRSGVFLLNTALTVEIDNAGSHLKFWKDFTKEVIKYISIEHPCIWMLWGKKAQKFKKIIKKSSEKNYILEAPHPAARDNSFRECGYKNFLDANKRLGKDKIKW